MQLLYSSRAQVSKQQLVHPQPPGKVIADTRHSLPHVWPQKSAKMQEITSVFDELIVLW